MYECITLYNSNCIILLYIIISNVYFNSFMNCYLLSYVIVPLRDSVMFFSVLVGFSFPFLFLFLSFFLFFSLTIQLLNGSGLTCVVYCRSETSGSRVVTATIARHSAFTRSTHGPLTRSSLNRSTHDPLTRPATTLTRIESPDD